MKVLKLCAALAGLLASPALAEDDAKPSAPASIKVMVVGSYHFGNPGQDVVNMKVDDVLAPRRQQEIKTLVNSLAAWMPTKIAVEDVVQSPGLEVTDYGRTQELLTSVRSESVQVGYRLARQLGHEHVYGFDEMAGEGEPDYFPFGKVQTYAQENGQSDILNSLIAHARAKAGQQQADLPNMSIAQSLLIHNDPDEIAAMHDTLYYSMLKIGDHEAQPGAELNAYWYMRNAKMFAKIDLLAEPGDRVLIVVGSGHAAWLRHFAERMPGYELVEAMPYIEKAVSLSAVEQ